ncbi:MBL fold metallo-hydrolase [Chlamydiifrater phoenicopteri]|uniref:MBL fold metallo-hydrolase n=1 Tax=Chlamydiifrater phoenicopteri TaxID=2681469 RepID=UPI001FEC02E7|nr:MBL fold metallo-hydrolase [Chlamydiifrater phoenicopteri]
MVRKPYRRISAVGVFSRVCYSRAVIGLQVCGMGSSDRINEGKFIFLGTGNPEGVPVPFCSCSACKSGVARLRSSALILYGGKKFLIDTGPDLRQQLLRYSVSNVDGIFLTHTHYDHIGGIDEMRSKLIVFGDSVPVVASSETIKALRESRKHFFQESASLAASFSFIPLEDSMGQGKLEGLSFSFCSYFQNEMQVTGFRLGNLAYLTDMQVYEDSIFSFLEGVDTLVLSAIYRELPNIMRTKRRSHLTVEESLDFFAKSGASRLVISHIGHVLQRNLDEYKGVAGLEFADEGQELRFFINE